MKNRQKKIKLITLALCLLFGHLGVHRFYLKKYKSGTAMLLTAGGLGIWYLTDIVLILRDKLVAEKKRRIVTA